MKKILYISTRIPALSMTFVDREIRALTEAGYTIKAVSRSSPIPGDVSDETVNFYRDSIYLNRAGIARMLFSQGRVIRERPREWLELLSLLLREKELKTPRDRFRLLHHFLEAGYVYTRIKGEGIDHIHSHILNAPTSIALCLSRYLHIPYSFTMHGSQIYLDPLMLGTKLRMCRKAVTISQYNKRYLLNKYGEELAAKLHIIHCGIDPELFIPFRGEKKTPAIILAVGRLIEIKGFRYLLDACRILKDAGMDFDCLIAGDGEEIGMLKERSAALGITDVVTFLGRQPQEKVHQLLCDASIFVLPSIITDQGGREGIPVSLMEAMAMELPVVSTRTVGIPELVEEGREGLLVEQRNSVELAAALELLIRDAKMREEMGRRGREKVTREFNINRVPELFYPVFN